MTYSPALETCPDQIAAKVLLPAELCSPMAHWSRPARSRVPRECGLPVRRTRNNRGRRKVQARLSNRRQPAASLENCSLLDQTNQAFAAHSPASRCLAERLLPESRSQ